MPAGCLMTGRTRTVMPLMFYLSFGWLLRSRAVFTKNLILARITFFFFSFMKPLRESFTEFLKLEMVVKDDGVFHE